ncbi:MAG: hypothetical protein IJO93_02745 [Clostridia bacterium]|nr:hypothetical protein [Clostridia bacterium]
MSRLIRVELKRMFRDWVAYGIIVFFIIFAAAFPILTVLGADIGEEPYFGMCHTAVLTILPLMCGAFAGLFISREFGVETGTITIRNKIIAGHRRLHIYIADLIVIAIFTLMCYVIYEVVVFAVGAFLFDFSTLSSEIIIKQLLLMALLIVGNVPLCVAIAYILRNVAGAVLGYMVQMVLMTGGMLGQMSGVFGKICEVISRFSPQGQIQMTAYAMPDKVWLTILCTLALGLAAAFAGGLCFSKCDLK